MTKAKYLLITTAIILILLLAPTIVDAADKYTATSTINGVPANWEYELNDSNQIQHLKCTNPKEVNTSEKTEIKVGNDAIANGMLTFTGQGKRYINYRGCINILYFINIFFNFLNNF